MFAEQIFSFGFIEVWGSFISFKNDRGVFNENSKFSQQKSDLSGGNL